MQRRAWLSRAGLGWLGLAIPLAGFWPASSRAGAQVEEPLADAVRTALSAAIHHRAPPVLEFADAPARQRFERWQAAMGERLVKRLPALQERQEFLQAVWYQSRRAGLEAALVLGLIQVESGFRKFAISRAGARGYMQVMPFWSRLIGDGDAGVLFHMETNLRFGCVILRHYLSVERGDLFMALGRYNGSRGQAAYPSAVLAATEKWRWSD